MSLVRSRIVPARSIVRPGMRNDALPSTPVPEKRISLPPRPDERSCGIIYGWNTRILLYGRTMSYQYACN